MKFKPKNGGYNVNPNMPSADHWENTSKAPCTRCQKVHRWNSDICMEAQNKNGEDLEPLSAQEFAKRLQAKWDRGFYFSKQLKSAHSSPTVKESAAASSSATTKLSNNQGK
jgi:hypothetical protein